MRSAVRKRGKLNRSIPGQMSDSELYRVIELAAAVPPGGVIVEVGALYGLGSWHLAKHCAPDVTVFCIDPWQRDAWIVDLVEKPQNAPPFSRQAFEGFTSDCDNIVMIEGLSPDVARGWKLPIDLYVEDAIHTNPILDRNLDFWSARVKPGGIISGHDFEPQWPDVMKGATRLANAERSKITLVDTYWSLTKSGC